MERDQAIAKLISYALERELIQPSERSPTPWTRS